MTAEPKEQDIEETLRKLGIDEDMPPDVAATEAAAAAAQETGGAAPSRSSNKRGEPALIPSPKDDEDDDEDEDEEGDDEDDSEKLSKAARTAASVLDTGQPTLIPTPRAPRANPKKPSAQANKLGKGLADKVPGAEKLQIHKRIDGKLWFIAEYTKDDLSSSTDVQAFITNYVKPKYGAGEYELVGIDGLGREIPMGTVRQLDLPGANSVESGALALVESMMRENRTRDEQWRQQMEKSMQQPAQKDPIELLAGVMNLKKQMDSEAEAGASAVAAAANKSSSETMQMMMLMMQQSAAAADRQNQMMMQILTKPKEEDPMMKLLMMKLLDDKKEDHGSSGMMPMPPPPVQQGPNMAELLTAMGGFMAAVGGGGGGGDDDFKEFLKQLMLKKESESLGVKEVLAIVQGQAEKPGTDDFRRSIDNMAAIMNVAQTLNKGQEAGPAAGFFDALGSLFSNRDFAGGLASAIRAKTDQSGNTTQQRLEAERQRLEMVQRQQLRERAQLEQLAASVRQNLPNLAPPAPAAAASVIEHAPVVSQTAQAPQASVEAPVVVAQPTVTPEAVQKAAENVIERTGVLPTLPPNTTDHIARMAAARDDAELVARTVELLIHFAEDESWSGFSETLLGFVRDGNKQGTLQYLKTFFSGLTEIGKLPAELAQRTFKAVYGNMQVLQEQLTDFPLAADAEITGDTLLSGGVSQAAP